MDLSKLSDEQLEAYQALKSGGAQPTPGPGVPKPPDYTGLPRRFAGAALENMDPRPLGKVLSNPMGTIQAMGNANRDAFNRARSSFKQGNYGEAAKSAVGAVPLIGPAAEQITREATGGQIPEAAGHAAGLIAPIPLMKGAGRVARMAAEPLAETALGATMKDRLFDANPGKAALDETSGFRPAKVAESAHNRLTDLKQEQGAAALRADANGATADLTPARTAVDREFNHAQAANAGSTAKQLKPMSDYFTKASDPNTFGGLATPGGDIAPRQPISQALAMRQEFPDNFRINYGGEPPKRLVSAGRQAYRGLSDEIKDNAPQVGEYDTRMHDLIPVAERATKQEAKATLGQRLAGRIGAHTGALAGAIGGYHYGGVPGAVAGFTIPELLADPTLQMAGARGLNAASKAIRMTPAPAFAAPGLMRTIQK